MEECRTEIFRGYISRDESVVSSRFVRDLKARRRPRYINDAHKLQDTRRVTKISASFDGGFAFMSIKAGRVVF